MQEGNHRGDCPYKSNFFAFFAPFAVELPNPN